MRIGIDLGGSHIAVGLVNEDKLLDDESRSFTKEDRDNIEDVIIQNIIEEMDILLERNNLKLEEIEKIGIASPGTISNGVIVKAGNLNIENFHIIERLQKIYPNSNLHIRNDGKCAALAEKVYGAMKDYEDSVFINIGTGIGGAVFMGGRLLEPKRFSGYELGHMIIEKNGRQCTCGKKGCFETYCSIKALKSKVVEKLHLEGEDISGRRLREEIIPSNKENLNEELDEYVKNMVVGLGNIIDIFEPEVICFGGSFSYWDYTDLYKKVLEEINKPEASFNKEKPIFVSALFKNDAGIVGATIG